MIMSLEEFRAKRKKSKDHKYGAIRCESKDGVKFPSKLEKMYYDRLVEAKEKGKIDYFLMQVPFRLPGNTKYIVDFMVVKILRGDGCNGHPYIEYVDVKGKMLPMAILKIKQVQSLYPVNIKIVDAKYLQGNYL